MICTEKVEALKYHFWITLEEKKAEEEWQRCDL